MDDPSNPRRYKPPSSLFPSNDHGRASRGRTRHRDLSGSGAPTSAFMSHEHPSSTSTSVGGSKVASRLMHNVRRSLSYNAVAKKRDAGLAEVGMHSTPDEIRLPPRLHVYTRTTPYEYQYGGDKGTEKMSPSIEQIAMGLHISSTPHLGPTRELNLSQTRSRPRDTPEVSRTVSPAAKPRPSHNRRDSAPVVMAGPNPTRSSLKKPSTPLASSQSVPPTPSDSNVSLSTVTTSTAPSTPRSTKSANVSMAQFSSRLHLRMSKLLLPTRKNSASSMVSPMAGAMLSDDKSANSDLTPRKMVRFSQMSEAGHDP